MLANPEEEGWLNPDLLQELSAARVCQLTFKADPDLPAGGFVILQADSRVCFGQTFQGISVRGREALRAEIARKLWES